MEQVNTFTRQLSVNYGANIKHISGKLRNQVYIFRHEECIMPDREHIIILFV